MTSEETEAIPLAEESAHVHKKSIVSARVTVKTVSESIDQTVREQLESQTVEVTRVPVEQEVAVAPPVRSEKGVTIVPVLEERLVVEKKLFLIEELHIRTKTETERVEVPVSVRRQRAVVEREPTNEKI